MNKKLPKANWVGASTSNSKEYITLVDIIGTTGFAQPGNSINSISYTLGNAASGETYTTSAMSFSPPGFTSMAIGPGAIDINGNFAQSNTSPTSGQALALFKNDQWMVLGTRDTRVQNRPGNLGPGDSSQYALIGQASCTTKSDGSVTLSTTDDNTAVGNNVQLTISPTGLYFIAPFGRITFDAAGFRVTNAAGATFTLNATADPITGNSIMMSAGSISINSGMVLLGQNLGIYGGAAISAAPVVSPGQPIVPSIPAAPLGTLASASVFISP